MNVQLLLLQCTGRIFLSHYGNHDKNFSVTLPIISQHINTVSALFLNSYAMADRRIGL